MRERPTMQGPKHGASLFSRIRRHAHRLSPKRVRAATDSICELEARLLPADDVLCTPDDAASRSDLEEG